jgi:hypothetical protein
VLEAFSGPSLASPSTSSACASMSSESSGGMHSIGRQAGAVEVLARAANEMGACP